MRTDVDVAGIDTNLNKSALRTMAILDYMSTVRSPVSISELSRALSIPKSSVFNLVYTLVSGRYIEVEDERLKTYRLGFRLFQTGITYLSNVELHEVAHPMLRELMTAIGQTVHLGTEDEENLVFLDSIEAEGSVVRSIARLGRTQSPMYCSGLGKALLAAHPDDELVRRYRGAEFKPLTPNTVRTFNHLMDEIRATRRRGYAVDDMESNTELFCVASPVYDRSRSAVAAISCSAPAHEREREREFAEAVTRTAIGISERLGFLGTRFYAELS
jgi:DNA-binding IclR family transcriptional regulator